MKGDVLLGVSLFVNQIQVLPDNIIGTVNTQTRTITLNKCYDKLKSTRLYIAMLEDAANKKYDCILRHDGSDVTRELSRKI